MEHKPSPHTAPPAMANPAHGQFDDGWAAAEATPEQRRLAVAAIVAAALVTVLAFALIFYRSSALREPTSAIVVEGDESLDGTEILVTSDQHPGAKAVLNNVNNYVTPVLLHPGLYVVTIKHKGHVLVRQPFSVDERRGLMFPVGMLRAAAAAATRPTSEASPTTAPTTPMAPS